MNPARSLAPAAIQGEWSYLWIYLLAPVSGAMAASFLGPLILGPRETR